MENFPAELQGPARSVRHWDRTEGASLAQPLVPPHAVRRANFPGGLSSLDGILLAILLRCFGSPTRETPAVWPVIGPGTQDIAFPLQLPVKGFRHPPQCTGLVECFAKQADCVSSRAGPPVDRVHP